MGQSLAIVIADRSLNFIKWIKPLWGEISSDPAVGPVLRYSELTCGLYFKTRDELLSHVGTCGGDCERRMTLDDESEDSDATVRASARRVLGPPRMSSHSTTFPRTANQVLLEWMDKNRHGSLEPTVQDINDLHNKTGKEAAQIFNWIRNTRAKKMQKVQNRYVWKQSACRHDRVILEECNTRRELRGPTYIL